MFLKKVMVVTNILMHKSQWLAHQNFFDRKNRMAWRTYQRLQIISSSLQVVEFS
jgi:hypothetical protein